MRELIVAWAALLLSGCALGHVRELKVGAAGPYHDVHAVRVEVDGNAPAPVADAMRTSAQSELASAAGLAIATSASGPSFLYTMHVTTALEPASSASADATVGSMKSATGFAGADASRTGLLAFDGDLLAPDGKRLGHVRWEGSGSPAASADRAAFQAAEHLGHRFYFRRDEWVDRRAADERLFLTATPMTLEPGEFVLSNDEGLLFRAGAGIGRRTQIDVWSGALPVPLAGGGPIFLIRAVGAAGGAGLLVLGFTDVGLKHRFLDETDTAPAISASYDLLDVFLGGVGGGGIIVGADAIVGGAGAGVGLVNVQFNLGTLTIGKHFGRTHVVVGGYLLDNHHFLPQKAGFYAGGVVAASGNGGSGATGVTTSGGTKVPRLPTQYQAWGSASYTLGEHSALGMELMPRDPIAQSFGTTGVRWVLGGKRPWGPFALDRVRFRIDLAAIWLYTPPRAKQTNPDGSTSAAVPALIAPRLPWFGVGMYW
ncbi:MAG TPA: hypothetical protein VMV18_10240 [bacterium]|nr:hypothetical protein [bacterium]